MVITPAPDVQVRRHAGRDGLRALDPELRRTGLLPPPVVEMEPGYLGEGFEQFPGATVTYRGDRAVGYMPYAVRHTRFPIAVGPTSFVRFPCRQLIVFGCAADGGGDGAVLDRLCRSVVDLEGWDVIQAFQLPTEHPLARYLAGTPFGSGRHYRPVGRTFATIQLSLESTFDRYLTQQFTRKTRYNLRREVRLAEESRRVALGIGTSAADVPEFLRAAESIARKTYQWKLGFATVRATPEDIRRISYLAARGYWRGYVLTIDDVPAAYCHATVRWGALSYDAVGYDPDFARLNPGKVLLYKIIEDLHAWRGVTRLEFGRGAAQYKQLFANAEASELDITMYRSTWYAEMLRCLALCADVGYRRLRPLVRPCLPYVKRLL